MNEQIDRLYDLLPVVHRRRDSEQGWPLRALLQVIAEQVNVVEDDIRQLYENWFIETSQDWVVPYIGDLLGYQPVHEAGEPGDVSTLEGQQRNKIVIPRREVANTIRYRRRRGTLALLELLAGDVAGWPARAVEFYPLLGQAQRLAHLRPERGRTIDLRRRSALDRLDGPFDRQAHTVDVRRIVSHQTVGRYNVPSVGIFVWRLNAYSVTSTQATCLEDVGPHCFTFSILGNDTALYTNSLPETDPTHIAEEINLPVPIRRRAFEDSMRRYYGEGKSLQIWIGSSRRAGGQLQPVRLEQLIAADLTDWQYRPRRGQVAVDPVLGRIAFPPSQLPSGVWVSYYYGFSADIGGGEYNRPILQAAAPADQPDVHDDMPALFQVGAGAPFNSIERALDAWSQVKEQRPHAVIEIIDNGVYSEQLEILLNQGQSLQIRASNRKRPVLYLLDRQKNRPDSLTVTGESGGCFTLDGLLITGRGIHVEGVLDEVNIRHCTLVPGWELHHDCEPHRPAEPSLEIYKTAASVYIEHSIIGSIQVYQDEVQTDPMRLHISDSILDATSFEREALGAPNWPLAHATLTIIRSTVFGQIQTHAITLAENCIFMGLITVARRQIGCMRFCYAPPGSRTPRRYNCQPDLVDKIVDLDYAAAPDADRLRARDNERLRVRPQFNSVRYGMPSYCQLAQTCAIEITRGADDESEMGVFHDLFQPQRAANLRARLDEYMPAGMEAGIIYAS